jgi:hypothetical protein
MDEIVVGIYGATGNMWEGVRGPDEVFSGVSGEKSEPPAIPARDGPWAAAPGCAGVSLQPET